MTPLRQLTLIDCGMLLGECVLIIALVCALWSLSKVLARMGAKLPWWHDPVLILVGLGTLFTVIGCVVRLAQVFGAH